MSDTALELARQIVDLALVHAGDTGIEDSDLLEQKVAALLRPHVGQPVDWENLAHFLAREFWDEWHGPLAKNPGSHEQTVQDLLAMFDRYRVAAAPAGAVGHKEGRAE